MGIFYYRLHLRNQHLQRPDSQIRTKLTIPLTNQTAATIAQPTLSTRSTISGLFHGIKNKESV